MISIMKSQLVSSFFYKSDNYGFMAFSICAIIEIFKISFIKNYKISV